MKDSVTWLVVLCLTGTDGQTGSDRIRRFVWDFLQLFACIALPSSPVKTLLFGQTPTWDYTLSFPYFSYTFAHAGRW